MIIAGRIKLTGTPFVPVCTRYRARATLPHFFPSPFHSQYYFVLPIYLPPLPHTTTLSFLLSPSQSQCSLHSFDASILQFFFFYFFYFTIFSLRCYGYILWQYVENKQTERASGDISRWLIREGDHTVSVVSNHHPQQQHQHQHQH